MKESVKKAKKAISSKLSAHGRKATGDFMTRPGQLCENFCAYYRPGKDEDLACLGFVVIEGLIKKGLRIPLEKGDLALDRPSSGALSKSICPACPFYKDGCDFAAGKAAARPCGGFLILGRLVGSGAFDIDDLQNMD